MSKFSNDPVARLLELHAADELRAYGGNLSVVVHTVERDWVPAENDPGVPEFIDALQQYLAGIGHPEEDSFLLRYALTVPGRQRGILPPMMVLGENRGGFSDRRKREAEGQVRRLREALALGRHFYSELDGDTKKAIMDLASRCLSLPYSSDEVILGLFSQLDDDQAMRLAAEALKCVDADERSLEDIGTRILRRLACFYDGLGEEACETLVERGVFWPSSLYRDASDSVASNLVQLIERGPEQITLSHLLIAIAWTRSQIALQAFRRWAEVPPHWAATLNRLPEEFLPSAGWCLDQAGNRRDLISLNCHRLVGPTDSGAGDVACRTTLEENCPACGGPQSLLFDFSKLTELAFAGTLAEAPRRVLCCLYCACYESVFTRYFPDGTAEWLSPLERSKFPNEVGYTLEPCSRTFESSSTPPFACANAFDLSDASTLGGFPMWVQDAEIPRCIECGQFMTFLAQHDNGPMSEEGIYYAFFCAECHVAAVSYQQT